MARSIVYGSREGDAAHHDSKDMQPEVGSPPRFPGSLATTVYRVGDGALCTVGLRPAYPYVATTFGLSLVQRVCCVFLKSASVFGAGGLCSSAQLHHGVRVLVWFASLSIELLRHAAILVVPFLGRPLSSSCCVDLRHFGPRPSNSQLRCRNMRC